MFMDPIAQAHLQHRQREVRQIMNEARMNRDSSLQDKAMTLQQQMMPEQMDLQTGMMKPMMFTMVFIIGIFAWLTTSVENFRVDYVSFLGLQNGTYWMTDSYFSQHGYAHISV